MIATTSAATRASRRSCWPSAKVFMVTSEASSPIVITPASGAPTAYRGTPVFEVPSIAYRKFPVGLPSPQVAALLTRFKPDVLHAASPFMLGAQAIDVAHPALVGARRVVVKVGSSSISGEKRPQIEGLVDCLVALRAAGIDIVLVSSGAIATGMPFLQLQSRPSDLPTQQAAAAVGQNVLMNRYQRSLTRYGIVAAQILLSAGDFGIDKHRENARNALERLLELDMLPIVNENDTVATHEIRFGDNDRLAALVAHLVHFAFVPFVGHLADRFGRRPVYYVGAVLGATWGFFAFPMMNSGDYLLIMAAIILGLMIHSLMYAPQPAIMAEMFPTRMRYSGVSLGYQVTSIVAGSLAPAIATWLLDDFGTWIPVAVYLAAAAVITFVAAWFTRETNGLDLKSLDEADREQLAKAGIA